MTDQQGPDKSTPRPSDVAPESYNSEQEERGTQAQDVADEARALTPAVETPTDSVKGPGESGIMDDSTQDLIDHMNDMEESGRIDMGAFRGEPNFDDEDETYGEGHDPDGDDDEDGLEKVVDEDGNEDDEDESDGS